jgi:hypothetical protein
MLLTNPMDLIYLEITVPGVVQFFNLIPQNPVKTILPIVVPDSSFLCALRRLSEFIGDNTSVNVLFNLLLSTRSAIEFSK